VVSTDTLTPFAATAERAALRRAIERSLMASTVQSVCQPIVSLRSGEVLGQEALSRPDFAPPLDNPQEFLATAAALGLAARVDESWRNAAVARFGPMLPADQLLFLNCSPASLISGALQAPALQAVVDHHGLAPERVVLEITEEQTIDDFDHLRRVLGRFRSCGFLLAIDDAGAGQSSLQSSVELHPDFIKLDRWLTRDIGNDGPRRSMVEAIAGFARQVRARVVAEGIETPGQLRALVELGLDYGQGYFLGRPAVLPGEPPSAAVRAIQAAHAAHPDAAAGSVSRVGDLAVVVPTVDAGTPGVALFELFRENRHLEVIAVVQDGRVAGVVSRGRLFERMSGQFGLPLNERRPALQICSPTAPVPVSISARDAARVALKRPLNVQQDPLVLVEEGRFAGIVGVHDLLQQVLTEEIAEARLSSPLTGLPGNRLIRQDIEARIKRGEALAVVYADIDNFKAFNDRHGFAHGDAAILGLATVLREAADACAEQAFVGHIGGDDFVTVIAPPDLPAFRHVAERGLAARWFDGERKLDSSTTLTVSVGARVLAAGEGPGYEDIAAAMAEAKRDLKARGGNRFEVFGDGDGRGGLARVA